MLTMVLGGLWHGAAWGFVLWGTLHGTCLVAEHQLRGRVQGAARRGCGWAIVFHVVVLGWILFRAENLTLAGELLLAPRRARAGHARTPLPSCWRWCAVIGFQLLPERPLERAARAGGQACGRRRWPRACRWSWRSSARPCPARACHPFIYFQF